MLGWVLVVLGTVLVVFMGGLGIILGGIIAGTNQPGSTSRFTGGPEVVLFIVVIFGLVILFGLVSMATGAWQIWYGKPNTMLRVIMIVVAGLLFLIGSTVSFFD